MLNEDLYILRREAQLSVQQAANICFVTRQTYRLWESGKIKTPQYATTLLQYATGHLPVKGWEEWRFVNGKLYSDTNEGYTTGDIRSIQYLRALNDTLEAELAKVRPKERIPEQLKIPFPHTPAWKR